MQATGTINPVNTVPVGSVVSGNVVSINVDFNSKVKKGDILAQIDPVPFQNRARASPGGLPECRGQRSQSGSADRDGHGQRGDDEGQRRQGARGDHRHGNAADAHKIAGRSGCSLRAAEGRRAGELRQRPWPAKMPPQAQEKQAEAQLAATVAQRDQAKAQVLMKKAAVDSAQTAAELLHDSCSDRRHGDQPHRERGPAGGGQPAGAEPVQHRAGSDAHAGVHEHGRGGRGPHQGGQRRPRFAWIRFRGKRFTGTWRRCA